MVLDRESIELDPESELATLIVSSGRKPVAVHANGRRYLIVRGSDDGGSEYDRADFEEALRAVIGTITPEEADRLKDMIYRGREEGTRPLTKA